MDIQIYSQHYASDGKWGVCVTILEEEGFEAPADMRASLKAMIDRLYNEDGGTIATTILQEVMGAVSVEVRHLYGPTVIARKE